MKSELAALDRKIQLELSSPVQEQKKEMPQKDNIHNANTDRTRTIVDKYSNTEIKIRIH